MRRRLRYDKRCRRWAANASNWHQPRTGTNRPEVSSALCGDVDYITSVTVGIQEIVEPGNRVADQHVWWGNTGSMKERMQVVKDGVGVASGSRWFAKTHSCAIVGAHTCMMGNRALYVSP